MTIELSVDEYCGWMLNNIQKLHSSKLGLYTYVLVIDICLEVIYLQVLTKLYTSSAAAKLNVSIQHINHP